MNTNFLFEDDQLLDLLLQGNKGAFTTIYNKYHKMLYLLAYKYLQDPDLSADVVQHVYMRLWESRSMIQINTSLKNYLYTMAKNHILNLIRDRNEVVVKQYELLQQRSMLADEGLVHKLEEEKKISRVYKALDFLPKNKKEICLLKISEGLNNEEIAQRMNMPVSTVKNYYTQSIKLLKYYLKQIYLW